jgi:glycosyltransferase involved in cell wall biosynthesis
MNQMKVVMIGGYPLHEDYYNSFTEYANITRGGVPMHIDRLTYYVSQMNDVELHIITFGNKNEQFKKDGFNIHVLKRTFFTHLSIIIEMMLLKRKIMEINPDIVHVQGTSFPYSLSASLVQNKYPVVLTVHGVIAEEYKFQKGIQYLFGKFIAGPIEKYAISKIANIIACSPAMKSLVSDRSNSKIYIVSNGVDFDDIQNIQPHRSIEHPSILFVGLLRKVKGVDLLLKAVPIILKSVPNIHVYIVGSGEQETELKRLAKNLSIEKQVIFLGFISVEDKYSYYKSTDICAFPSIYEPFGIALLEAMACSKPIVASNVGGIPFVVENGKTGLLFECWNVEELAEKVIILLKDKELREQMGKAGRERAKGFTWDKIAEQTVELYKKIIEIKRWGSLDNENSK